MLDNPPQFPGHLETGYRRFRATRYAVERRRYLELGERGQSPPSMVIACADSRSAPDTVFDAAPGELFVLRNVAALVPVYAPDERAHAASAALEFAVLGLAVSSIVVMGHGRCGGIRAALDETTPLSLHDFVGAWMGGVADLARDLQVGAGSEADPATMVRELELRSVERSIANLRTFPWIASREAAGDLRLHGAWFDISEGLLHVMTPAGWAVLPED